MKDHKNIKNALEDKGTPLEGLHLENDLKRLAGIVANMPDREPPDALIFSVMKRIRPKKLSLFRRVWLAVQSPISMTPLKIAPAIASLILVFLFIDFFPRNLPDGGVSHVAPVAEKGLGEQVLFTLDVGNASRVDVIGSFNQWRPGEYKMHWDEKQGAWVLALRLDRGRYEYAFLVDGEKVVPDPKSLLYQEDGFGSRNSVLIIERHNGDEKGI